MDYSLNLDSCSTASYKAMYKRDLNGESVLIGPTPLVEACKFSRVCDSGLIQHDNKLALTLSRNATCKGYNNMFKAL